MSTELKLIKTYCIDEFYYLIVEYEARHLTRVTCCSIYYSQDNIMTWIPRTIMHYITYISIDNIVQYVYTYHTCYNSR